MTPPSLSTATRRIRRLPAGVISTASTSRLERTQGAGELRLDLLPDGVLPGLAHGVRPPCAVVVRLHDSGCSAPAPSGRVGVVAVPGHRASTTRRACARRGALGRWSRRRLRRRRPAPAGSDEPPPAPSPTPAPTATPEPDATGARRRVVDGSRRAARVTSARPRDRSRGSRPWLGSRSRGCTAAHLRGAEPPTTASVPAPDAARLRAEVARAGPRREETLQRRLAEARSRRRAGRWPGCSRRCRPRSPSSWRSPRAGRPR